MSVREKKVHWLLNSRRRTACGRPAKKTKLDTRTVEAVTCKVCKVAVQAKLKVCEELWGEV